jgi:hypothetical protein
MSALNLDGQLASRDELRVMEMAIRNDIHDVRIQLGAEVQAQTRTRFSGYWAVSLGSPRSF